MDMQLERKIEAYKWLYTEVLLRAFNDILPIKWYEYHMTKFLKNRNKNSRKVLRRHFDAINWLLTERHEICFEILGLSNISDKTVLDAIEYKMHGPQKFMKLMRNYQEGKLNNAAKEQRRNSETNERDS
jgi:hypothetical protein